MHPVLGQQLAGAGCTKKDTPVKHNYSFFRRNCLMGIVLTVLLMSGPQRSWGQSEKASIDFFSGFEVGLYDFYFYQKYNVVFNLTPGFKWNMGNHWQLAGQARLTVINQLSNDVRRFYPSMLVLSKELKAGPVYLKGSVGAFSNSRYGFDLKAFLPVTPWLAFEAQAGLTGLLTMAGGWGMSPMGRFTGTVGGDIYLSRWNTQLRGVVGKYVYTDWGFQAEAMRHFNHATVGLYAKWNNIAGQLGQEGVSLTQSLAKGMDGGFKVTIMLPPYKRTHRTVNFRPASHYSLTYLVRGMAQYRDANQLYYTDPEENMRDGWFSRDLLKWGSHTMEPDFIYKGKEETE